MSCCWFLGDHPPTLQKPRCFVARLVEDWWLYNQKSNLHHPILQAKEMFASPHKPRSWLGVLKSGNMDVGIMPPLFLTKRLRVCWKSSRPSQPKPSLKAHLCLNYPSAHSGLAALRMIWFSGLSLWRFNTHLRRGRFCASCSLLNGTSLRTNQPGNFTPFQSRVMTGRNG